METPLIGDIEAEGRDKALDKFFSRIHRKYPWAIEIIEFQVKKNNPNTDLFQVMENLERNVKEMFKKGFSDSRKEKAAKTMIHMLICRVKLAGFSCGLSNNERYESLLAQFVDVCGLPAGFKFKQEDEIKVNQIEDEEVSDEKEIQKKEEIKATNNNWCDCSDLAQFVVACGLNGDKKEIGFKQDETKAILPKQQSIVKLEMETPLIGDIEAEGRDKALDKFFSRIIHRKYPWAIEIIEFQVKKHNGSPDLLQLMENLERNVKDMLKKGFSNSRKERAAKSMIHMLLCRVKTAGFSCGLNNNERYESLLAQLVDVCGLPAGFKFKQEDEIKVNKIEDEEVSDEKEIPKKEEIKATNNNWCDISDLAQFVVACGLNGDKKEIGFKQDETKAILPKQSIVKLEMGIPLIGEIEAEGRDKALDKFFSRIYRKYPWAIEMIRFQVRKRKRNPNTDLFQVMENLERNIKDMLKKGFSDLRKEKEARTLIHMLFCRVKMAGFSCGLSNNKRFESLLAQFVVACGLPAKFGSKQEDEIKVNKIEDEEVSEEEEIPKKEEIKAANNNWCDGSDLAQFVVACGLPAEFGFKQEDKIKVNKIEDEEVSEEQEIPKKEEIKATSNNCDDDSDLDLEIIEVIQGNAPDDSISDDDSNYNYDERDEADVSSDEYDMIVNGKDDDEYSDYYDS